MKKIVAIVLSFIFVAIMSLFLSMSIESFNTRSIKPIRKQVGKLNISVDPRLELLCVIQGLSEYKQIQRNNTYFNAIQSFFASSDDLQAVQITNELAGNGFTFDAPVTFMLYLTNPIDCEPSLPYSDCLIKRAQGEQHLSKYQKAIHEFALETEFNRFWDQNKSFYNRVIDLSASELSDIDWISALEKYFNDSHNSYNIIISPLLRGGYGPSVPAENSKKDLYACLPLNWKGNDSIPYLDRSDFLFYLWHEFSHSFVNPEVEKYPEMLERTSMLFKPIQDKMARQAYKNWMICINEHIVRAVNIRLTEKYIGKEEADLILKNELNNYFVYIEPLLAKLKEYEDKLKIENITFSDYVPDLLQVFDSISKTNYETFSDISFSGPINNVFQANKITMIYPTNDVNNGQLEKTKKYVEAVHDRFFKQGLLIPDTVALKTDLSGCGLIVYGTIESNLFLKEHESQLPFKIKDNTIITDQTYFESGLRFITCLPNPQNKKLGMVVYTAVSDKDIPEINNVFHGPEDYILFINRDRVLKKGVYKKTDKWEFY